MALLTQTTYHFPTQKQCQPTMGLCQTLACHMLSPLSPLKLWKLETHPEVETWPLHFWHRHVTALTTSHTNHMGYFAMLSHFANILSLKFTELLLQMCDFFVTLCLSSLYSLFTFVYSRSGLYLFICSSSFITCLLPFHMLLTFYHMHTIFHMLTLITCLPFITCYFIYLDYKIPAVICRT